MLDIVPCHLFSQLSGTILYMLCFCIFGHCGVNLSKNSIFCTSLLCVLQCILLLFDVPDNPRKIISVIICCCSSVCSWVIDPPLEITVPSKRTPWPDAPPELPTIDKSNRAHEQIAVVKRPAKTRGARSKRSSRSKRKHESRTIETHVSAKQTELN